MRILITGSAGFVGTHLRKQLAEYHDVFGFDVKGALHSDVRDRHEVFKQVELCNPDVIIHLAAEAGLRRGEEFPKNYFDTNVWGTQNVVDAANRIGVRKLIHFSSSAVYPSREGKLDEGIQTAPIGVYGLSKLLSETIAAQFKGQTWVIRPFTLYGEHGRGDQVLYKFINQIKRGQPITIYGDGSTVRGYTHVKDLCDAIQQIAEANPIEGCHTMNLGGAQEVAMRDLVGVFEKVLGDDFEKQWLPLPECDVRYSVADISKARVILGWEPKRDFFTEAENIIRQSFNK